LRLSLPFAFAFSCALVASPAEAIERQHHLGVGGGLAMLRVDGKESTSVGLGGAAHYGYGLNDTLNLVVEGGWARVAAEETIVDASTPRNRPTAIAHGGAGVMYTLDVIRWVPYFGGIVAGYALTGGTLPEVKPAFGVQLAGGIDYQITRSVAAGFAVRQHFLFTAMSTYPSYTSLWLRAEYVWGW